MTRHQQRRQNATWSKELDGRYSSGIRSVIRTGKLAARGRYTAGGGLGCWRILRACVEKSNRFGVHVFLQAAQNEGVAHSLVQEAKIYQKAKDVRDSCRVNYSRARGLSHHPGGSNWRDRCYPKGGGYRRYSFRRMLSIQAWAPRFLNEIEERAETRRSGERRRARQAIQQ